jgi:hypothetical protein
MLTQKAKDQNRIFVDSTVELTTIGTTEYDNWTSSTSLTNLSNQKKLPTPTREERVYQVENTV